MAQVICVLCDKRVSRRSRLGHLRRVHFNEPKARWPKETIDRMFLTEDEGSFIRAFERFFRAWSKKHKADQKIQRRVLGTLSRKLPV